MSKLSKNQMRLLKEIADAGFPIHPTDIINERNRTSYGLSQHAGKANAVWRGVEILKAKGLVEEAPGGEFKIWLTDAGLEIVEAMA